MEPSNEVIDLLRASVATRALRRKLAFDAIVCLALICLLAALYLMAIAAGIRP